MATFHSKRAKSEEVAALAAALAMALYPSTPTESAWTKAGRQEQINARLGALGKPPKPIQKRKRP